MKYNQLLPEETDVILQIRLLACIPDCTDEVSVKKQWERVRRATEYAVAANFAANIRSKAEEVQSDEK